MSFGCGIIVSESPGTSNVSSVVENFIYRFDVISGYARSVINGTGEYSKHGI